MFTFDRSMRDIAEEWLVIEAQCGDEDSWKLLVELWDSRLNRRATRHLGKPSQDVVQEVWLAVARGIRRLDDPARFGPWVYRILARRCADRVRQSVRDRRPPAEHDITQAMPGDEIDDVRRAMAKLNLDDRFLLSMRHGDGLPLRVIAEILGVAEGTVKSRLHAARLALRTELERAEADTHPRSPHLEIRFQAQADL